MTRRETAAVLGVLGLLVAVAVPDLGSGAWQFVPWRIDPRGPFGPIVRAADREFDVDVPRSAAMLAGLLVALAVPLLFALRAIPRWLVVLTCVLVIGLLTLPATFLQVGLRDSTEPYAPWIHVNDSTYQIELAGDLVLDGHTPYGKDYRGTGLEKWYPAVRADKEVPQVALDHFAYFPGTALTAAAWRVLPRPFDDYRLFVLLCTMALFVAAFVVDAPLPWKLAVGAALAANPLAIRAAWFGTADAPSVLLTVLAFALVTRSRYVLAAACLGGAVLLKQFALVALPFLAVMLLTRAVPRRTLYRAAAAFAGILVIGFLPFVIADPGGLWDDTIAYGAQTYRIIGYGLAGVLLKMGVLDDRYGPYPFLWLALFLWLPLTAWLAWAQWRSRRLWVGAAAFAAAIFCLLYVGRVFQTSYLIWPFSASLLAFLLASSPASNGSSARS